MTTSILSAFRAGEPCIHFIFGLCGIPHCGIELKLLCRDAFLIQGFDRIGGTGFRIRVTRSPFDQHILNFTVFVQIPRQVGCPVFGNQLTPDNPGFFGVGTDKPGFVVTVEGFCAKALY